jgi:hypothetical protein
MSKGAFAVLKDDSPFRVIFTDGKAPIFPIGTMEAELAGTSENKVYMIDVNRLEASQVEQLAEALAKQCNGPKDEALNFLMTERRLPIRVSQVQSTEGLGISLRMVV